MDMAIVIGSIVSTQKHHSLEGVKICIIQPIDHTGAKVGNPLIATDMNSQVGLNEKVFFVTGGDAVLLEANKPIVTDAAIVGIIDTVNPNQKYLKELEQGK